MMDNTTLQIKDDMLVDLAYTITVENNEATDAATGADATASEATSIESKPMTKQFVQGGKRGVPGLEQALYGMAVGEEKEVVVSAADGYGEVDPNAVKTLSRQSVPLAAQAKPGERVRLLHKRSGTVQKAVVVEVQPEKVVLDFNHPLAGKTLHYRVRVDGVRPATAEELEASQATDKPAK